MTPALASIRGVGTALTSCPDVEGQVSGRGPFFAVWRNPSRRATSDRRKFGLCYNGPVSVADVRRITVQLGIGNPMV